MATSDDQRLAIVKLIGDAGFANESPDVYATAVAIALRESNLNPGAFNGNKATGDESYGLFQINLLGSLRSRLQSFGLSQPSDLLDPANNARAAYQMYKQSGFHAWLGYRPGLTVAKQLPAAQGLVKQVGVSGFTAAPIAHGIGKGVPLSYDTADTSATTATVGTGSIEDTVRELYGYSAIYLDDPEIGPVLRQAAEENWSPQRLQGALFKTQWWQTTQSSARTFDNAYAQDPATVESQIQQQMADIKAQASQLGYVIDVGHLHDMARDSLRLGWDATQIANAIGAESFRSGKGGASTTMQAVRTMISDYGIPMSDATMNKWGEQIATGQSTSEDLRQQLVGMAKGLFPGVADQLDKGLTVRQLADPYIELAAQTLEISPSTIDFKDPRWSAALNGVDTKGVRRSLTLSEWSDKIKADASYGWQKTKAATAQAFDFADTLGKTFGKVAN